MPQPGVRERAGVVELVLLLALTAALFGPSAWRAESLNFDDPFYYGTESLLRDGGIERALDPGLPIANAWLPVTHLSIWLDHRLFAGPVGPHLHSLLLHALAAFCLARLCGRLGLGRAAATAAAVVFLVHPALVECSLWLSSRKDLLAGLFAFLALDTVAAGARGLRSPARSTVGAAALALLAVFSKGSALVLPLCALVVLWLCGARGRRAWPPLAALTVVALGAGLVHTDIALAQGTIVDGADLLTRLSRVPGAFFHYVATALWPTALDVLYPEVATLDRFASALWPGLAIIVAWVVAIAAFRRRAPTLSAGLAWFALALLPYNTALPATSLAAADRYLYLAIPGLALALGGARRPIGALLCLGVAIPLAALAHSRAADFESSERLWRASLGRDPVNAVALVNLADALQHRDPTSPEIDRLLEGAASAARYAQHRWRAERFLAARAAQDGRLEAAYRHADRAAAAIDELGDEARHERMQARLLAAQFARLRGDSEGAELQMRTAEAIAPDHPAILCDRAARLLAAAMDETGRAASAAPAMAEARVLLERALSAAPDHYDAHWLLGRWSSATGALLTAAKHYADAIALARTRPEAHLARIELFLQQEGMAEAAESAVREAMAAGVNDPRLRYELALALGQQGRLEDARRHYEAYLRLQPNDRDARLALARVTAAIGHQRLYTESPEALDQLADRVLELDPDNATGRLMRAVAARGRHDLLAAQVLLEQLYEESPEDREIRQLYAETLRDRGWQLKLAGGRDDAAFAAFVRFLAVAPAEVPTDAVSNAVEQEWRRQLEVGKRALIDRDPDGAEAAFRRCLELRPEVDMPNLQLGISLLLRGPEQAGEALECFERAAAGMRREGGDASLAVLYQVRALRVLGREDEAVRRGEALLAAPGEAPEEVLERIRAAIAR